MRYLLFLPLFLLAAAAPLDAQDVGVILPGPERAPLVPQPVPETAGEFLVLFRDGLERCRETHPDAYLVRESSSIRQVAEGEEAVQWGIRRVMEELHGEEAEAKIRQASVGERAAPRFDDVSYWVGRVGEDWWQVVTDPSLEIWSWTHSSREEAAWLSAYYRSEETTLSASRWDGEPALRGVDYALKHRFPGVLNFFRWAARNGGRLSYDAELQQLRLVWDPAPEAWDRTPSYLSLLGRFEMLGGRVDVTLKREVQEGQEPVFHYSADYRDAFGEPLARERFLGIGGGLPYSFHSREMFVPGSREPYFVERQTLVRLPAFPFSPEELRRQALGVEVDDHRDPDRPVRYEFTGKLPTR